MIFSVFNWKTNHFCQIYTLSLLSTFQLYITNEQNFNRKPRFFPGTNSINLSHCRNPFSLLFCIFWKGKEMLSNKNFEKINTLCNLWELEMRNKFMEILYFSGQEIWFAQILSVEKALHATWIHFLEDFLGRNSFFCNWVFGWGKCGER